MSHMFIVYLTGGLGVLLPISDPKKASSWKKKKTIIPKTLFSTVEHNVSTENIFTLPLFPTIV